MWRLWSEVDTFAKDSRNACFAARKCDDENVEFGRVLKDPLTSRGTHFGALEIYSIHLLYMALDHLDVKTSQRWVSSFSSTVQNPLYSPRHHPLRLWYNTPSNSYRWAIISGKFRKIAAIGWVWALWTFRENSFSEVGTYISRETIRQNRIIF